MLTLSLSLSLSLSLFLFLSSPPSLFSLSPSFSLSLSLLIKGDVNCYGHEQVDESVSVSLNIADLRVDAFVKSGIEPAKGNE